MVVRTLAYLVIRAKSPSCCGWDPLAKVSLFFSPKSATPGATTSTSLQNHTAAMSMTVGGKHQAKTIQTGAVSSAKKAKGPTTIHNDPYSRALSLYQLPPTGEVTPEEFETLALDRIKCASLFGFC